MNALLLVAVVVFGPAVGVAVLVGGFAVLDGLASRRAARRFDRVFADQAGLDIRHTAEPTFLPGRRR